MKYLLYFAGLMLALFLLMSAGSAKSQTSLVATESVVIDFSIMDEKCRTDPTLQEHCFTIPKSYAESVSLWDMSVAFAEMHGDDPERVMERLIHFNGWQGATRETRIPAEFAFRQI